MSLIVACPYCQTRYNLPDKFKGKKVKCKSCGKPFSAEVGAARASATKTNQTTQQAPEVDPQELAKMGIGTIRQQPDPFSMPAHQGPDPLRNHVVQDPGFMVPGHQASPGMPATNPQDPQDVDPDYQAVVSNPYIKEPPKPAHAEAATPSNPNRKKKKRKNKVHPAVKESLDKATMTLLIVGVMIALLFGFFFISAHSDAVTYFKNQNKLGNLGMTDAEIDEMATVRSATARIVYGVGILIGVWFMILGVGVQIFPITSTIIGLASYIIFELLLCIILWDFLSLVGWLRRAVVCAALGKALMDALNARSYNKMMEERRASGR